MSEESTVTVTHVWLRVCTSQASPFTNFIDDEGLSRQERPGFTRVPLPHPFTFNPQTDNLVIDGVLASLEYNLTADDDDTPKVTPHFQVTYVGVDHSDRPYAHECLPARIQAARSCIKPYSNNLLEFIRAMPITYVLKSEVKAEVQFSTPQVYRVGTWNELRACVNDLDSVFLHGRKRWSVAHQKLPNFQEVLRILALPNIAEFSDLTLSDQQALEGVLRAIIWQYCEIDCDSGIRGTRWPQVKFYSNRFV